MNQEQKNLRTTWGIASRDFNSLKFAHDSIPKKYKRQKRMIKHVMDKLEKRMNEAMSKFTED